jgi:hypothetical protein
MSISKLFHVASIVAFVAGAISGTVFGHSGLELVSAGLGLYVSGDLAEDILSN